MLNSPSLRMRKPSQKLSDDADGNIIKLSCSCSDRIVLFIRISQHSLMKLSLLNVWSKMLKLLLFHRSKCERIRNNDAHIFCLFYFFK